MPINPTLGKLRQEDQEFEARMNCITWLSKNKKVDKENNDKYDKSLSPTSMKA
jgi:hypothetical protein